MADVLGTQEVSIWSKDETKAVDVVTDTGGKNRLCMDGIVTATISNDESPTRYQLKTDYDVVGDTLTSAADTTLYSYTGQGILDFLSISGAGSGYQAVIVIDGTERFRASMLELGTDLALTGDSAPLWTDIANKNFRFYPRQPLGFATGFAIKARATGSNILVKHICMYREKTNP